MRKTGYTFILTGLICSAFLIYQNFNAPFNMAIAFVILFSLALFFSGFSFFILPLSIDKRKKFVRVLFIVCVMLQLAYFLFKHRQFTGANIIAILLFFLVAFIFLPVYTKNRIEKWKQYTRKAWHAYLLSFSDLFSMAAIYAGLLFKVMHWPFASLMLLVGVIVLGVSQIGWNRLFSREIVLRKEAEDKVTHAFLELEEKNKEILDSINYAKRLQEAILPSEKTWNTALPNSFVLYKPKDIVAGDFYWLEMVKDKVLFAAADCTGHGVPGALVSVVCSNALNRAVKEFNISDPGKILDKVRELVIETFVRKDSFGEKSENEVKDGMDISLCVLNINTNEIKWAGANNPLWYVSQNNLTEIKADKQPIGKYAEEKPFTTHTLQLNKGDMLYLFTDGYADQFGGPKGKKFKYKQLLELVLNIHKQNLPDQKKELESIFTNWRGKADQIDDVCIIGVKI